MRKAADAFFFKRGRLFIKGGNNKSYTYFFCAVTSSEKEVDSASSAFKVK